MIREANLDSDLDFAAEMMSRYDREAITGDDLRKVYAKRPDHLAIRRVVAEVGGKVVAFGASYQVTVLPVGWFWMRLYVDEPFQGQGVGRILRDDLVAFAEQNGAKNLHADSFEDGDREADFLSRSGFEIFEVSRPLRLDLEQFDPASDAPVEVRLQSFAEEPNVDLLYEIASEGDRTAPNGLYWGVAERSVWERTILASILEAPQATIFALDDAGEVMAFSSVYPRSGDQWTTEMTAVREAHRGKGLGYAVKHAATCAARASGASVLLANNEISNAPMTAINRRLGFVESPGMRVWRRQF